MRLSKTLLLSFLAASTFLSSGTALATQTPTSIKGAEIIDVAKAKSMMDSGVKMIDARVANEYAEEHIKGSINVPHKGPSANVPDFDSSQDSFDLAKVSPDKNAPVILYCNGVECWKSYKAAVIAVKAGYKKIYVLRDGIPAWKAKGLPIE